MEAFNYIMDNAEIKPQMAQIECHPLAQRTDARELYANNYDIQVECWYPLNHNRTDPNNTTIQQIAQAHGRTACQVILRWHMQEGLCPVPGSTNAAHIAENINIFDFELTDEEMAAIRAIDRGDAGRSFNLQYGNWGFGNFQDYNYNHTFTPAYLTGDVNFDGEINIGDVTGLIDFLLSDVRMAPVPADVNEDGETNIGDVTALIDILLRS